MSEAEIQGPDPPREIIQDSAQALSGKATVPGAANPATDNDNQLQEWLRASEGLSRRIERFSTLSFDMTKLLSELPQEVKKALDQLLALGLAADFKKEELRTLHNLEVSAASLKQLIEESQLQRESLERLMEGQRKAWEEEKAQRAREETEYREGLMIRRRREEEEYRNKWAAEHQRAQQQLEAELRDIEQKSLEKQALERYIQKREQTLKDNELEWVRITQELEQFMSMLASHIQVQIAADAELFKKETAQPGDLPVSSHGDNALETPDRSAHVLEKTSDKGDLSHCLIFGGWLDGRAGKRRPIPLERRPVTRQENQESKR